MSYQSRIIVPLHNYFWRFKLTPAGRAIVLAMMLSALGSVSVEIPIYQVFCGLLGLLIVTEPLGLLLRPRLELSGELPERVRAAEPFTSQIRVTNRSWTPAFDLMAGLFGLPKSFSHIDADRYVPSLARGESAVLPVTLHSRRRGVYRLPPVHVHSTFPFNLMRFGGATLPARSLTVTPAYHSLETVAIPASHRYQPGGTLLTARVGDSMEYIGNREYQPGEPLRRLDTRAWARLGRPIVREYQEEYSCRVAILLDTYVPARRTGSSTGSANFEAAVSLTAAVAETMSTGEFLVDVFAAGPNLHVFRSSGGSASFTSVLEILAAVGVSRGDPFAQLSPAVSEELFRISTVICVLLDWDEPRRRLADHILEAGCAFKVVVVRNRPTTIPFPVDEHWQQLTSDEIQSGQLRQL